MSGRDIDTKRQEPRKLFAKHIVRKIFFEDWAMKLTALVITLGLWFGVTGRTTSTTRQLKVPLDLSISSNAEITNSPLQELDIFITGDKRRLDELKKAELVASLDLTEVPPGDRLISLTPETVSVNIPEGIKVDTILQTRIFVRLEAVEEKDVDVKAHTVGSPAEGYEIYNIAVIPQNIRVRGPASFIRALDFIETDKIDLSGKTNDFAARQIPVTVLNPKVLVLNSVVDIYFRIGERRVERSFVVPVTGSPGKMASFTLFGPRTLMFKAKADAFKVEIVKNEVDDDIPQLIVPTEFQNVVEMKRLIINP